MVGAVGMIGVVGKDMVSCGNQSYVVGFADGLRLSHFDLDAGTTYPAAPQPPFHPRKGGDRYWADG